MKIIIEFTSAAIYSIHIGSDGPAAEKEKRQKFRKGALLRS